MLINYMHEIRENFSKIISKTKKKKKKNLKSVEQMKTNSNSGLNICYSM